METKAKTIVDFIPIAEGGDLKRVKDNGPIQINNIITCILNQLDMEEGTVEEYPNLGCYQEFIKILYSERPPYERIVEIENRLTDFFDNPVKVTQETDDQTQLVKISIVVEGIPGTLTIDIKEEGQNVKLLNPKFIV